MSIFIPYNSTVVIEHFTNLYSLNLSTLTDYQILILTIFSNIYFLFLWFFVVYFSLKIFNRIWERIF